MLAHVSKTVKREPSHRQANPTSNMQCFFGEGKKWHQYEEVNIVRVRAVRKCCNGAD